MLLNLKFKHLLAGASLLLLAEALPALEPGDDEADCVESLVAYSSSRWDAINKYTTKVITTSVYNFQKADAGVTTLCDGRPRVLSTLTRTTETYDPPLTETIYSHYDVPTPTCSAALSACREDRICEPYTPCTASGNCFIYGDRDVKLYYWPVETRSGDFCSQDGSTIFAEPTSPPNPNTAVVDGHTFTSPTNYISFNNPSAVLHGTRRQRTSCGSKPYHDVVVPLTETLSSLRWGGLQEYSFNFADLNTAPVEPFDGQRRCRIDGACATIEGEYTPRLPLPTEIRNIEQEWIAAGCRATSEGYYATAIALATPAPTMAKRAM